MPQLRRYYGLFPARNIRVFIYEELFGDLEKGWDGLCGFLGISPDDRPPNFGAVYNPASGGRRSEFLHSLITKKMVAKKLITWAMTDNMKTQLRLFLDDLNKKKGADVSMSHETHIKLAALFKSDMEALEQMLGRPLSGIWLKP
jgi:hypothetical protein